MQTSVRSTGFGRCIFYLLTLPDPNLSALRKVLGMITKLCTAVLALNVLSAGALFAQDAAKNTLAREDISSKYSSVKIVAEPKTSRPFDWKVGGQVTIGVRWKSQAETRVIGIATDIKLVDANVFENRVEMELRGEAAVIKKLVAASRISEYWFEVMPFKESHRKTLETEVDLVEFLKAETAFRPVTESDWGYGATEGRLRPPTLEELPNRK